MSKLNLGLEEITLAFLEQLAAGGGKPLEQLSPGDARKVLEQAQIQSKVPLPDAEVSETLMKYKNRDLKLIVVHPPSVSRRPPPVFMFFHGGGWVLGDYPTHQRLVRDLVHDSGAAAVFVEYSRSPEARYPEAINECFAATQWVAENGDKLNVDSSRLAVAGNSVGGNITCAVSMLAKKNGGPKIRYQALLWPVADSNFETGSYSEYQEGYFLTRNMMKWFWDSYIPDVASRNDILASPMKASIEDLKGLPPTLIQTAEFDVLRDEGEAFGRRLDAAGVDVTVTRYNGMIHDFGLLNALSQVAGTRSHLLQAGSELRKHLVD